MNDFIYNQHQIPKKKWRYGFRSSAATGCGWIATYNALRLMGYGAKPEKLIRYYEKQVPLINGNFGTFLFGPAIYFWSKGFKITPSFRRNRFDRIIKESDAAILFYYWRQKWKFGAHFVTVCYKEGCYLGYNTFRNSQGPDSYGDSASAFIKNRHYFGTFLFGIRKPKRPGRTS